MKAMFCGLLLLSGAAGAQVVTPLSSPAQPVIVNLHWMHCAAIGFNANHTISGACQISYSSCSGRYCHSPSLFYTALWADNGSNPQLGVQCAQYPAGVGAATITYSTGYNSTNCSVNYAGTGTVVGIPYGPYSWQVAYYYYVSTDPVTGDELVNSNAQSFLVTP
jgi:hypothetical protein